MGGGDFGDTASAQSFFESTFQIVRTDMAALVGKKESGVDAVPAAQVPQQLQRVIGQVDIAVFTPFAVDNPQQLPFAVDIADGQTDCLGNAQTTGINERQGHPVDRISDLLQDQPDFFSAQNHRQFLGSQRFDQVKDLPRPLQGGFVEELDARDKR